MLDYCAKSETVAISIHLKLEHKWKRAIYMYIFIYIIT